MGPQHPDAPPHDCVPENDLGTFDLETRSKERAHRTYVDSEDYRGRAESETTDGTRKAVVVVQTVVRRGELTCQCVLKLAQSCLAMKLDFVGLNDVVNADSIEEKRDPVEDSRSVHEQRREEEDEGARPP